MAAPSPKPALESMDGDFLFACLNPFNLLDMVCREIKCPSAIQQVSFIFLQGRNKAGFGMLSKVDRCSYRSVDAVLRIPVKTAGHSGAIRPPAKQVFVG